MSYDDTQLATVLNDARRIAIVGLSRSTERPGNQVALYLKNKGYQVIRQPCLPGYPGLQELRVRVRHAESGVDLVVVFRRFAGLP